MKSDIKRDVEKSCSKEEFAAKLRRLADAIENDQRFQIQIAGERIHVPVRAVFTVEHEKSADEEEIENSRSSGNASEAGGPAGASSGNRASRFTFPD